MLRTREIRVFRWDAAREGWPFQYLPDSVPMRASFWHWAPARAFSSLFLPTTGHLALAWLYRDQLRQIHQDSQIRADRYVRHAEYRFIFTSDRHHPLGLQLPRRTGLASTVAVSAIRKIWEGIFYLRVTNAKFRDETKFWRGEKKRNFIRAYTR